MTVLKTPLLHTEVHVHPMSHYVYTGLAENTVMEVGSRLDFSSWHLVLKRFMKQVFSHTIIKITVDLELLYNKFLCKKFS